MSRPCHAGLGLIVSGLAWNRWNSNEMIAGRTLNLASRECLIALQVLTAMGTGKLKFAHEIFVTLECIIAGIGKLVQLLLITNILALP